MDAKKLKDVTEFVQKEFVKGRIDDKNTKVSYGVVYIGDTKRVAYHRFVVDIPSESLTRKEGGV